MHAIVQVLAVQRVPGRDCGGGAPADADGDRAHSVDAVLTAIPPFGPVAAAPRRRGPERGVGPGRGSVRRPTCRPRAEHLHVEAGTRGHATRGHRGPEVERGAALHPDRRQRDPRCLRVVVGHLADRWDRRALDVRRPPGYASIRRKFSSPRSTAKRARPSSSARVGGVRVLEHQVAAGPPLEHERVRRPRRRCCTSTGSAPR